MYFNPLPESSAKIKRDFKTVELEFNNVSANSHEVNTINAPTGKLWLVKFMIVRIESTSSSGYVAFNWRLGAEDSLNDFVQITSDPGEATIIDLRPSGFENGRIERPYQFSDKKATQLWELFDKVAFIGRGRSRFTIINNTNEVIEQPTVRLYVIEE